MKGTGIPNNVVEDTSNVKWIVSGTLTTGNSLSWILEEKPDQIYLQGLDSDPGTLSIISILGYQASISDTIRTDNKTAPNSWYVYSSGGYGSYSGYFYWNNTQKTLEARFQ